MAVRYSKEIKQFIADNVKGTKTSDLVELVNSKFGTNFTAKSMKSFKANYKLNSGTGKGRKPATETKLYPREVRQYIKDNAEGVGTKEMTQRLNSLFDKNYSHKQIMCFYKNNQVVSGIDTKFKKGCIPQNKGQKGYSAPGSEKGWFKKGHLPANHKPVGSERIDVDGYVLVKTEEPNVWNHKSRMVWEEHNGPIPDKHVVTFLDGDKQNIHIDNLELISMAESLQLTRSNLRSENSELTKTGVLISRIRVKGYELNKKVREGEK